MSFVWQDINGPIVLRSDNPQQLFPKVSGRAEVAFKDHDDGHVGGIPGLETVITVGNTPLLWGFDDSLFVQIDLSGFLLRRFPDGRIAFHEYQVKGPNPYASEGLGYVTRDGEVVLGNDPRCHGVINGVEVWNLSYDEQDNLCGLSEGGGPFGCVVRILSGGVVEMCVVAEGVQIPPRISQGRVVWSVNNPPTIEQQVWVPYQPYVAPVEPPAPMPSTDVGPQRDCYIDDMSGLGCGNASGVYPGHKSAVFEDARFVKPEDEPFIVALVHGPFEGSTLSATIPMAQRLKKPVILSDDGHSVTEMQPHRSAIEAAGIQIWEGPETYPLSDDDTADAMWGRFNNRLVNDLRPHALISAGYGSDRRRILEFAIATNRLKERYPQVKQVASFGMDRPNGVPECRTFWRNVTAQTKLPAKPVPPPDPVVVPPVTPPVVKPKPHTTGEQKAVIVAAASLIGSGFVWLWRRLRKKQP